MSLPTDYNPDSARTVRTALLVGLLGVCGAFATVATVRLSKEWMREDLLAYVHNAGITVDVEHVQKLTGTPADVANPAYGRVKEWLAGIRKSHPEARFAYLMGRREDRTLVFLADSEPPDSEDYSAPGDVYFEAQPGDHEVFDRGVSLTFGPVKDRWGRWISASVPVVDPANGKVIASFGMDVAMDDYYRSMLRDAAYPLGLTGLLCLLACLPDVLRRRSERRSGSPVGTRLESVLLPLVLGSLLVSAYAAQVAHRLEARQVHRHFEQLAGSELQRLHHAIQQLVEFDLPAIARFYESSETVTEEEFVRFTQGMAHRSSGCLWEWAPQASPGHFPVQFMVASDSDRSRIGFDLASEPGRAACLAEVQRTGLPTVTGPIPPLHEMEDRAVLIVMHPVFHRTGGQELRGVVLATLHPGALLREFHGTSTLCHSLGFVHRDGSVEPLGPVEAAQPAVQADLSTTAVLPVAGRLIVDTVRPGPAFQVERPWRAGLVLGLAGVLLTLGLAVAVRATLRSRVGLERQVRERTADLLEANRRHDDLASQSRTILWDVDPEGLFTFVSPLVEAILGYRVEDLVGNRHFYDLHPAEGREEFKRAAFEVFGRKQAFVEMVNCIETAGGRRIWVATNGLPLLGPSGELQGYRGSDRDITAIKTATDALAASEACNRAIFAASPDLIFIVDREGRFLDYRAGAESEMLIPPEAFLNRRADQVLPPEMAGQMMQALARLFAQNHSQRYEYTASVKSGDRIFEARMERLDMDRALIFSRDITEHRRFDQERVARQAAEQANRAKSLFLSNMSHEIRTPLNAILGFAQLLKRDATLTPKQADHLGTITRSGEHLLHLINDILDISRIEAGQMETHPVGFDAHELFDDIARMFRFRAESKGLRFVMDRARDIPRHGIADVQKLRQVLINLLGNAVKFTREGGLSLRARAVPPPPGTSASPGTFNLQVEVEDSGPGISEHDRANLFQPFHSTEAGLSAGGTGLGLSICRNLVAMMGGSIAVESQVGKGSVFRFQIPMAAADGADVPAAGKDTRIVGVGPAPDGPWKILVVDDNEDNRALLLAMLAPLGFEIREAANGQRAVAAVEDWNPHLVLMDMRMPVMDGYEATRRIRAARGDGLPRILAVTASAYEDDASAIRSAGVDGYLRKPLGSNDLFAELERLLGVRFLREEPDEATAPGRMATGRPLSREDMAKLPAGLVTSMREAVESGDIAGLKALVLQAEPLDADVAHALTLLAERFDYAKLLEVLQGTPKKE